MSNLEEALATLLFFALLASIILGFVTFDNVTKLENRRSDALVVVETYNNLVIARDYQGNMFSFTSDENLQPNHIVAVTFDSKGTPEVEDDEIVEAHFAGTLIH